jgi:DNA-binding transcriptional regulator YiaG
MSKLQETMTNTPKSKASSNKKSKWREIEQLRDRFQLERELKGLDNSLEHILDDF